MRLKDIHNTKKELESKKEELLELKKVADKRAYLADMNQLYSKLPMKAIWYVVPYVLMILAGKLMANFNLFDSIPKLLVLPAFLIPSAIVGAIIEKKIENKRNVKERFEEFSTAKTEEEKFEEQMRYAIESKKYSDKIDVIERSLSDIDSKEKFLSDNGRFYTLALNENMDESRVQNSVDELSARLESNSKRLEVLSTQSVLNEKFTNRIKGYWVNTLAIGVGLGTGGFMYTVLPYISLRINFSGVADLIALLGIYALNVSIVTRYIYNRSKMEMSIFNKLNNELGEDALPETIDSKEDEIIDILSNKNSLIINSSYNLGLLNEEKSLLEEIKENKDNITESTQEITMAPLFIEETHEYTEGMSTSIEGPTLVKRHKK